MRRFKWGNIPIPPSHVITIIAGIALHMWRPLEFWGASWQRLLSGWSLMLAGIFLAFWAAENFEQMDSENPTALITTGPYAFSRNPMYVAWTLIYLAFILLVNTWWLVVLFPLPLLVTHFHDVKKEELQLERKFGDTYRQYRSHVRRYV